MKRTFSFPREFLWGCSAASYQIEGAAGEEGKGLSNWDVFCRQPGKIREGHSGRIACDHYHRWEEDLDLIARLGIPAYRFSISWPRVIPNGRGAINEKGLAFYDKLVDGMLERGIKPCATLYHWDLPWELEKDGGWQRRSTVDAFQEYAGVAARRLGDRVKMWFTLNEIPVVYILGYGEGKHAPGERLGEKGKRQVCHHLLLAHGRAVQTLRSVVPADIQVGLVSNPYPFLPFFETEDHINAAREAFYRMNAWVFGPVFHGKYPEKEWESLGIEAPEIEEDDLEAISEKTDFVGLNIYHAPECVHAEYGSLGHESWFPRTDSGWPLTPDSIYWSIRFTRELFQAGDVYITENGCCYPDQVNEVGRVDDFARVHYLRTYLQSLHRAVSEGFLVRGYFVWSIMDNFEWAEGYTRRFGIVHVNYETQKRTPKLSAEWYSRAIQENGF